MLGQFGQIRIRVKSGVGVFIYGEVGDGKLEGLQGEG